MFGFLSELPLRQVLGLIFLIQVGRYLLLAGGVFAFFWLTQRFSAQRIDPGPIPWSQIRREIGWSLLTLLIFLLPAAVIVQARRGGQTLLYSSVSDHGWSWFFASLVLLLFIHDLYFYLIHRAMHHPLLYRAFHHVHHRSRSPTPWAAFSFHPLEALLESSVVYLFVFLIPLHAGVIFLFQFISLAMNVYGHLGHDLARADWEGHPVLRLVNTTRLHHWHHARFEGNFGLYTTIWDRLWGTLRA
jgi:Delta7-sterol 5-desaturase